MIEVIGIPGSGKSTFINRLSQFDGSKGEPRFDYPLITPGLFVRKNAIFCISSNLRLLLFCVRYWKVFCSNKHRESYINIIRRSLKIFKIALICREYNTLLKKTAVQEGVLHLMHNMPDDLTLFFKRLLSVYNTSTISIIFLKTDFVKSLENHCFREKIIFEQKDINKYKKSLSVLEKMYNSIVLKKKSNDFYFLNKSIFLTNNEQSTVNKIYKNLR